MRPGQNGQNNKNRHNNNQRGGYGGGGNYNNGGGGGGNQPRRPTSQPGQLTNRNQSFDSVGPDEKRSRGTAWQLFDKYSSQARDALATNDRILAESFLQHAEHYQRIINLFTEQTGPQQQRPPQSPQSGQNRYGQSYGQSYGAQDDGDDDGYYPSLPAAPSLPPDPADMPQPDI